MPEDAAELTLVEALERRRRALRWTVAELSAALGISGKQWALLRGGKQAPQGTFIMRTLGLASQQGWDELGPIFLAECARIFATWRQEPGHARDGEAAA